MTSLLRNLVAPAMTALALCSVPVADAAFNVNATVTTVNGAAPTASTVPTTPPTTSVTIGGATITFNDFASSGNTTGAIPSEAYTLSGSFSGSSTAVQIIETITITNNGATGTLTEVANFTLSSLGLIASDTSFGNSTNSVNVGGTQFTGTQTNATSAQFGQTVNNGAISAVISANAVPEPASLALLGLGLMGTVGIANRRRLARG